jgi:hypothetical protein
MSSSLHQVLIFLLPNRSIKILKANHKPFMVILEMVDALLYRVDVSAV